MRQGAGNAMTALLSTLRDRNTATAEFRRASDLLAPLLCAKALDKLADAPTAIETPLGAAPGLEMPRDILLVPVLRAGLALLPAFMRALPESPVAMLGVQRDEATAQPLEYYSKLPDRLPGRAIILDPMLATAGTACLAAGKLLDAGLRSQSIYYAGVIAAQEGLERLARLIPSDNITVVAVDPHLDRRKFIVPGLGDYGDRYFGT